MHIELSDTDVLFIYGHFQKQITEIDQIAKSPDCPFDKGSINKQKTPYLSVMQKLAEQVPNLKQLN